MKFKNLIPIISFILLFCFVGCDDEDYSSDIDALKKELEETKAAVKTIQDLSNALQNQLFINSYEKTEDGYTLKMSDGSIISVTQGQKGDDGTDAPTITDIKETENALEFVFSDGSIITLPKEEKYDVITLDIEVTNSGRNVRFEFIINTSNYLGDGPLFSFPENLEINWGDGRITASSEHEYKAAGKYSVTIKAKQIQGLKFKDAGNISNIDASQCSNLKYIELSNCKGEIKICNSPNLIEIDGDVASQITKLELENLPNLEYVEIGAFHTESSLLEKMNINNCPRIKILDIHSTKLTSIDISGLTNLYEFRGSDYLSTIWVWDGFDPSTFDEWLVPEGVECKIKQ